MEHRKRLFDKIHIIAGSLPRCAATFGEMIALLNANINEVMDLFRKVAEAADIPVTELTAKFPISDVSFYHFTRMIGSGGTLALNCNNVGVWPHPLNFSDSQIVHVKFEEFYTPLSVLSENILVLADHFERELNKIEISVLNLK